VRHYHVIDPEEPVVVHHERAAGGIAAPHILKEGALRLDPPGSIFR
jgi:hypothetical protein